MSKNPARIRSDALPTTREGIKERTIEAMGILAGPCTSAKQHDFRVHRETGIAMHRIKQFRLGLTAPQAHEFTTILAKVVESRKRDEKLRQRSERLAEILARARASLARRYRSGVGRRVPPAG